MTYEQLHPHVFSWPPGDAFPQDGSVQPEDMRIDLVDGNVMDEFERMIHQFKDEKKDEPFCAFDVGNVLQRYRLWKKAFPLIKPFFALKVYSDPVVIKLLSQLGAGFDCASKAEIDMVLKLGAQSEDIVFANPIKMPSHLTYAANMGVSLMTFDSYDELVKVKELYPDARLLLRICPIEDHNAYVKFHGVFGCNEEDVKFLLRSAKQLGLNIIGVSFHVGSGCSTPHYYIKNIELAKKVFDAGSEEGIDMNILDIGGGFSGIMGTEDIFLQMSDDINACISELFSDIPSLKVIAEPGRYFVEGALTLATSIVGRRTRKGDMERNEVEYFLSASAYGILNRTIAMSGLENKTRNYTPALAIRKPRSSCTNNYIFRGPTVSPADVINCINLPELEIGDWLIFDNVGAYTVTLSSNFNGLAQVPIRRLIRRDIWKAFTVPDTLWNFPVKCAVMP